MLYRADVDPPKPLDEVTPNVTLEALDWEGAFEAAALDDAICETENDARRELIEARALTAGAEPLGLEPELEAMTLAELEHGAWLACWLAQSEAHIWLEDDEVEAVEQSGSFCAGLE